MTPIALADAKSFLRQVGYAEGALVDRYRVWAGGAQTDIADLVAFGRPEALDMSTATVAVCLSGASTDLDRTFAIAKSLATPFVLSPADVGFDIWIAEPRPPKRWKTGVGPDNVIEIAKYLRPAAALNIKVGLQQLPLFDIPVNLLADARDRGAERLAPIIEDALVAAASRLPSSRAKDPEEGGRRDHRRAARLVVGALTALVMRDRNDWQARSAEALLRRVAGRYRTTFSWLADASAVEREVLVALTDQLGIGIDYRSLDPAVLSQVYEEALVSEDDRQRLGIHYTPPRLATRLLAELPVELVPPTQRHVLDPACGSGTLLIAAHDRLRGLQHPNWSPTERHKDLRVHLRGFDVDHFAVEIARLTLLLHAQPAGNGWRVEPHDTIRQPFTGVQPSIIVTNPPWKYRSESGRRHQAADDFVEWNLRQLAPGGLLGMVLPQSWLTTKHNRELRERLTDACEVFEIWRLPEQTFRTSRLATAVLLARKRDGIANNGGRVVREVHPANLQQFLSGEPAEMTYLIPIDRSRDLHAAISPPTPSVETVRLDEIAHIRQGHQPKPKIRDRGEGTPYLHRFGDVGPYGEVRPESLLRVAFPEDFQTARGASLIGQRKVLVSAARSGRNPWQIKVAVDRVGIAMRNSMKGVAPRDQDNADLLDALVILLGSGFAHACLASHGGDRNMSAAVLPAFPVPQDARAIRLLARTARDVFAATGQRRLTLIKEAEALVWASYGIDEHGRADAISRLAGYPAPEGQVRYDKVTELPRRPTDAFRRVGVVLDISKTGPKLWVNGVTPDGGVQIALPARMPGWLTRPGATFDVTGVETVDDLACGEYRFQPETWRDPDLEGLRPRAVTTA